MHRLSECNRLLSLHRNDYGTSLLHTQAGRCKVHRHCASSRICRRHGPTYCCRTCWNGAPGVSDYDVQAARMIWLPDPPGLFVTAIQPPGQHRCSRHGARRHRCEQTVYRCASFQVTTEGLCECKAGLARALPTSAHASGAGLSTVTDQLTIQFRSRFSEILYGRAHQSAVSLRQGGAGACSIPRFHSRSCTLYSWHRSHRTHDAGHPADAEVE